MKKKDPYSAAQARKAGGGDHRPPGRHGERPHQRILTDSARHSRGALIPGWLGGALLWPLSMSLAASGRAGNLAHVFQDLSSLS
ncbi:hypothetical protein E2C01_004182 [Portunus trituberculatus]|uniref:Uncharacterized protein n=1 Tax=Portunus trituberculatus TaxID=210409 RepID=A0A5B7CQP8_PORTR|nr:hypothetical protein [Portunus trituberculatus]